MLVSKFKVTGTATDASGYNKLTVEHVVSNNTFSAGDNLSVHFTASGNDGAIPGYAYNFDTSTTDADPGAGDIRFNNGTYASATAIYIDDADSNSVAISTFIQSLSAGNAPSATLGFVTLRKQFAPETFATYKVTAVTNATGYTKLTVANLAANTTNPFSDSGGSLSTAIEKGVMVIKSFPVNGKAEVVQADAKTQRITNGKIVSTDPPYYDNIAYSDLSDFFYVWLRSASHVAYSSCDVVPYVCGVYVVPF